MKKENTRLNKYSLILFDYKSTFKIDYKPKMASQKRFELPTHGLEGRCSIQLSYWDMCKLISIDSISYFAVFVK